MKSLTVKNIVLIIIIATISASQAFSQVSISEDGTAANASAMLEVSSTNRGLLLPRIADTTLIASPVEGLLIYDLSTSCIRFYNGTKWSNCIWTEESNSFPSGEYCGITTEIIDVISPETGRTWMDRNLGATQVADSVTDPNAFGFLYQWGRASDGHQCRTSGLETTNATGDSPGHSNFITEVNSPFDWREPQNNLLWDLDESGAHNNPCPTGYHLPTKEEWDFEFVAFSPQDGSGAFNSFLKLTTGGGKYNGNGLFMGVNTHGYYWSKTIWNSTAPSSWSLYMNNITISTTYGFERGNAFSVRCIKNL